MADEKIFITTCRMDGVTAAKAMSKSLSEFELDERTYGGMIVADTFDEAEEIAIERGYGETVKGTLHGIIPFDAPIINPYNTSDQNN